MKRGSVNKKLLEEEQQAIGAIYKQYIDTFQEISNIPQKTFVKSVTLYAGEGIKPSSEKGQLYTPKPIIKYKKEENKRGISASPPFNLKREKKRKSSNLKSLGDELKILQIERQSKEIKIPKIEQLPSIVTHESECNSSTNLFVSNLSPHITEDHLISIFGNYGPLASVKIMWPRNEVATKTTNCGFVAFMSRVDAERALNALRNYEDMRINWGKSVKIPAYPVHIPAELCKLYAPPPPSGLPFNAQPPHNDNSLANATIKVTIPLNRSLLMCIHRIIEFVIREGPEFEALIMNMESENPDFTFLSDFQSPAHTYYRWKLYSILNGDPKNSWSMKPFRMYKNGSIWLPPIAPNYREGMPERLLPNRKIATSLSDAQSDRLIFLIKHLTPSRSSIGQAMVFCLNHASAMRDILELIADSCQNSSTHPLKKIARLYLISDILHNCKMRQIEFETKSTFHSEIFKNFHFTYKEMKYSRDKECFKTKILMVLRAWILHNFYDVKFISKLENLFLSGNEMIEDDDNSLNDEPLDGANLLKRSLKTVSSDCLIVKKKQRDRIDMFNP